MDSKKTLDTNGDILLQMTNISKEFPGVKALDGVHLIVRKGTVHALMGENGAGKSTLMKCLFGMYKRDSGEILLEGKQIEFTNAKDALESGVSMVHQELNQVLQRNVMDNIWLGRYPKKGLFVDEEKMYEDTKKIFEDLEITTDPRAKVGKLSVSEMQMLEIAKAVSYNSKIIVFDEPTSSLTEKEVAHLFRIMNKLRDKGCGLVYISHKMEEILAISDDVTIMRDGKWIATERAQDLTTDKIINMMVGRDLTNRFPPKTNVPKEPILKVSNLTAKVKNSFKDISFELREGEILGVAGLVGAKRTEVVEALFGLREIEAGEVQLHGRHIKVNNPIEAIKHGFALITEERRVTGIFGKLNISFNSVISNIEKYGKHENEVCIQLCYGNEEVGISIQNSITRFDSEHQKTGIGLQNISIMMEQMDGRMEVNADDLTYCIVLYFPEKKEYHKISKV